MASCSKNVKEKETFEVQLVRKKVKQPNFKAILEISYKQVPSGALSMILPKVVTVQDVRKCYNYKVGGIGDMEIRQSYDKLCENGVLKEEFKIVERKGLTHALEFPTVFKTKWIKIVPSIIHDGCLWLEGGPIKIMKKIVHRVTGYPTLDWPKTLRIDSKEVIEKNIRAKWNMHGMTIDTIIDLLLDFSIRVISHKFY